MLRLLSNRNCEIINMYCLGWGKKRIPILAVHEFIMLSHTSIVVPTCLFCQECLSLPSSSIWQTLPFHFFFSIVSHGTSSSKLSVLVKFSPLCLLALYTLSYQACCIIIDHMWVWLLTRLWDPWGQELYLFIYFRSICQGVHPKVFIILISSNG